LLKEENVSSLIEELHGKFDRIYVTHHWGKESEFAFHPSPHQRRRAREWVEKGADGIFGHHSHTVQAYEIYKENPFFLFVRKFVSVSPGNV
jgi:poly-gamma-glutamate synthesis protein (capsule biosynthesis protein)